MTAQARAHFQLPGRNQPGEGNTFYLLRATYICQESEVEDVTAPLMLVTIETM